jgi:hypothetical protein
MADVVEAPLNDEIYSAARREGIDFYRVARAAAKGDAAAMKRFFEFRSDGAAGEMHDAAFVAVTHSLGDDRLAKFLSAQPTATKTKVREQFEGSNELLVDAQPYLKRHFPRTAALLFQ